MSEAGKCTDKAIASCKKQDKLCNVETGRCVVADPKRKVKGAVYDKKRSLYFPQGLLFEDDDGTEELVLPKKKAKKSSKGKEKAETSSEEEEESPKPKKKTVKKKASPVKKVASKKKVKTPSSSEEEEESPKPKKKTVKKKAAPVKKVASKKKASCFEEEGECPDDKPICSVSDKGRGTCIKGSAKTLAKKSMIKRDGLTIVGSSDVLKKLRKDYDYGDAKVQKWSEEKEETSSEEEEEVPKPKKKAVSPKKKKVASPKKKKAVSPKKKTPSPKKKKAAIDEILCFDEEAEPCEDDKLCSATGKCVPGTTAFLRKKQKISLNGKEVYGTDLQFKSLAKKYGSVSSSKRYDVGEEIRIEVAKSASPQLKKTVKKIEEVVKEADLPEEEKLVLAKELEAAIEAVVEEEERIEEEEPEGKGKEKVDEKPKKKGASGRKKKQVQLPESESKQVEKSAEEIQKAFERCLGISVGA
ncbi:hypothetical protein PMV_295 [Port-miou virus]|uniref:Uncharacterized protein n=1 Tax=Port-miou virus TaxID=1733873 RepID=A0A0N9PUM9_9VIRU|nr:hypothetical protein PMV_295 [Port-miou virus]